MCVEEKLRIEGSLSKRRSERSKRERARRSVGVVDEDEVWRVGCLHRS